MNVFFSLSNCLMYSTHPSPCDDNPYIMRWNEVNEYKHCDMVLGYDDRSEGGSFDCRTYWLWATETLESEIIDGTLVVWRPLYTNISCTILKNEYKWVTHNANLCHN